MRKLWQKSYLKWQICAVKMAYDHKKKCFECITENKLSYGLYPDINNMYRSSPWVAYSYVRNT